jgi:pSer/pThr/pTyr-binding forkhead associated (FHA) protein
MSSRVTLTAVSGPLRGREFVFTGRARGVIGRSRDCLLPLTGDDPDLTVSRHHCLLDVDPPAARIRDLGSRNGTYVNGERLGRGATDAPAGEGVADESPARVLRDGDVIRMGKSLFFITVSEDSPDDPGDGRDGRAPEGATHAVEACRASG